MKSSNTNQTSVDSPSTHAHSSPSIQSQSRLDEIKNYLFEMLEMPSKIYEDYKLLSIEDRKKELGRYISNLAEYENTIRKSLSGNIDYSSRIRSYLEFGLGLFLAYKIYILQASGDQEPKTEAWKEVVHHYWNGIAFDCTAANKAILNYSNLILETISCTEEDFDNNLCISSGDHVEIRYEFLILQLMAELHKMAASSQDFSSAHGQKVYKYTQMAIWLQSIYPLFSENHFDLNKDLFNLLCQLAHSLYSYTAIHNDALDKILVKANEIINLILPLGRHQNEAALWLAHQAYNTASLLNNNEKAREYYERVLNYTTEAQACDDINHHSLAFYLKAMACFKVMPENKKAVVDHFYMLLDPAQSQDNVPIFYNLSVEDGKSFAIQQQAIFASIYLDVNYKYSIEDFDELDKKYSQTKRKRNAKNKDDNYLQWLNLKIRKNIFDLKSRLDRALYIYNCCLNKESNLKVKALQMELKILYILQDISRAPEYNLHMIGDSNIKEETELLLATLEIDATKDETDSVNVISTVKNNKKKKKKKTIKNKINTNPTPTPSSTSNNTKSLTTGTLKKSYDVIHLESILAIKEKNEIDVTDSSNILAVTIDDRTITEEVSCTETSLSKNEVEYIDSEQLITIGALDKLSESASPDSSSCVEPLQYETHSTQDINLNNDPTSIATVHIQKSEIVNNDETYENSANSLESQSINTDSQHSVTEETLPASNTNHPFAINKIKGFENIPLHGKIPVTKIESDLLFCFQKAGFLITLLCGGIVRQRIMAADTTKETHPTNDVDVVTQGDPEAINIILSSNDDVSDLKKRGELLFTFTYKKSIKVDLWCSKHLSGTPTLKNLIDDISNRDFNINENLSDCEGNYFNGKDSKTNFDGITTIKESVETAVLNNLSLIIRAYYFLHAECIPLTEPLYIAITNICAKGIVLTDEDLPPFKANFYKMLNHQRSNEMLSDLWDKNILQVMYPEFADLGREIVMKSFLSHRAGIPLEQIYAKLIISKAIKESPISLSEDAVEEVVLEKTLQLLKSKVHNIAEISFGNMLVASTLENCLGNKKAFINLIETSFDEEPSINKLVVRLTALKDKKSQLNTQVSQQPSHLSVIQINDPLHIKADTDKKSLAAENCRLKEEIESLKKQLSLEKWKNNQTDANIQYIERKQQFSNRMYVNEVEKNNQTLTHLVHEVGRLGKTIYGPIRTLTSHQAPNQLMEARTPVQNGDKGYSSVKGQPSHAPFFRSETVQANNNASFANLSSSLHNTNGTRRYK